MNKLRNPFLKISAIKEVIVNRFKSTNQRTSPSRSHYLLLSFPIASFCLGTWQVKRLKWKKGLINDLETRSQHEPVDFTSNILDSDSLKQMEYRRVIVHGKFDHGKEILLGPRSLNEGSKQEGGLGSRPTVGYHVVTPFIVNSGERILVNRGWVPYNQRDAAKRTQGQITDEIKLTGFIRLGEKRPQFSQKVKEDSLMWHYCDVDEFSQLLNTSSFLLDADSLSSEPNGPIGGQTRVTLRNEHMQYIITWYSLSVATLFLYHQFRKRPIL